MFSKKFKWIEISCYSICEPHSKLFCFSLLQKHCCPIGLICPDCFYWNPHVHCIVVTDLGKAKVVYVYFGLLSDILDGRSWTLLGCWWPVELMQLLNCLTAKVKNALSSMMRCEMSAFIFLINDHNNYNANKSSCLI